MLLCHVSFVCADTTTAGLSDVLTLKSMTRRHARFSWGWQVALVTTCWCTAGQWHHHVADEARYLPQVLQAVKELYGYDYRVVPTGLYGDAGQCADAMFHVNYLDVTRGGTSRTHVSSGQLMQGVISNTAVIPAANSGGGQVFSRQCADWKWTDHWKG
jgi:hypothetical protein